MLASPSMRSAVLRLLLCVFAAQSSAQDSAAVRLDTLVSSAAIPWSAVTFHRTDLMARPSRSLDDLLLTSTTVTRAENISRITRRYSYNDMDLREGLPRYSALHIRGSREGEIEYRFGGIPVLDRWTNTNGAPYIPEMLESVTVHTGAYGAGLGSAGGGVVEMRLRKGGDVFSAEASFLTDDVVPAGGQFLATSSYGWTTAVVTIGAPLPFDTRLFVAAEITRQADRRPMYIEPFDMTLPPNPYSPPNIPPPASLRIERNRVPSQGAERQAVQWNLTSSVFETDVAFFGSVASQQTRLTDWSLSVRSYYRQPRIPWWNETSTIAGVRAERSLGTAVRLGASASYVGRRSFLSDPHLGEAWRSYADSAANATAGFGGFTDRYTMPQQYSAIYYFMFGNANAPTNAYAREASDQWALGLKVDVQMSERWTMAGEIEALWLTERRFAVGYVSGLVGLDWDRNGTVDRTFGSDLQERVWMKSQLQMLNFGYSVRGDETDDGPDGPRRPHHVAASLQQDWRDGPLTITAGLRYQRYERDLLAIPALTFGTPTPPIQPYFDYVNGILREDLLVRSAPETYLLPRLSIQYATERLRLFVATGAYAELTPDQMMQLDILTLSNLVRPLYSVPYNLREPAMTDRLLASRTWQIEVGVEWRPGPATSLKSSVYHKRFSRQALIAHIPWYETDYTRRIGFGNSGESNAIGLELEVKHKPAPGVIVSASYALTGSQGYGSYPRWSQLYVTEEYYYGGDPPPPTMRPLGFDRPHRLIGSLEVRPENGSPLHGLDVQLIATVESGTPFTKDSRDAAGSASAWDVGVRSLIDPRLFYPLEPWNASRLPWSASVDLSVAYTIELGIVSTTLVAEVTNLLDRKNVANVFPHTGTTTSDGWLQSPRARYYLGFPQYESFYRMINLQNRWAYMWATGNDLYGAPRQIRIGARVRI